MGYEISQFDIPDRQLLASSGQPGLSRGTDIGEVKITRTIFGRAKVRVIREHDKERRAWLLMSLAVTMVAVVAWQWWVQSQQSEPIAALPPIGSRVHVSAPAFQPEYISSPAATPAVGSKSGTPSQAEIDIQTISQAISQKSAPLKPLGLKVAEQIATKPVTVQPLSASNPQAALPAINSSTSKNQADMQHPAKLSAPIQPAATTVVTPPSTPFVANKPTAEAPVVEPLIKDVTPALPPTTDNQTTEPVNEQGK